MHDKAAFLGGVGSVIEGGEGNLCAGPGMHRVEVVDEGFHCLEGLVFDFLGGKFDDGVPGLVPIDIREGLLEAFEGLVGGFGIPVARLGSVGDQVLEECLQILFITVGLKLVFGHADAVVAEGLVVGLDDAGSHGVIEVGDGLPAVHVVLVRLDGNAGQRGIGADGVRLADEAMAGREAFLEEFEAVNLAAGQGQGIEVEVMDMDIAVLVGEGDLRVDHLLEIIGLGGLATELEHRAHCRIGIDVGVFTLAVVLACILGGNAIDGGHEVGLGFADAGTVGTVKNVFLCRLGIVVLDEDILNDVLAILDGRRMGVVGEVAVDGGHDFIGKGPQGERFARHLACLGNRQKDFRAIEGDDASVSLDDLGDDIGRTIGIGQFGNHFCNLRGRAKKNGARRKKRKHREGLCSVIRRFFFTCVRIEL